MQFSWKYTGTQEPQKVKAFLKEHGVSKRLLAKIKFQGGRILVNGAEENVLYVLASDDEVTIDIPAEQPHETLLSDPEPLDVVFEDEHYLLVNKPAGVSSITSQYHPRGTMANRVKNYFVEKHYENQVVHVVTRLDRDTSGLMLFAKHGFAHGMMDKVLREKTIIKKYQALVFDPHQRLKTHELIEGPIARDLTSLIQRKVSPEGKDALTEYWLEARGEQVACVDIQLHTGRTHQIRVHFSSVGCPLLGDELYGGPLDMGITRQALHCASLSFTHPFTGAEMAFQQPLPADMASLVTQYQLTK